MTAVSRLPLAAVALFGLGVASATPAAAQKGEPTAPSKCDKLKKGSAEWKKCTGTSLIEPNDQDLYYAGYWLARTGQYAEALTYLNKVAVRDERVLTYIGFATRKLGDTEAALPFYAEALARNPNYTVARAYLGEAHLEQGRIADARGELAEIARREGTQSVAYKDLAGAFVKRGLAI